MGKHETAKDTNLQPKERILVVDDDKAFRVATKTLLEDEGYEVVPAASADDALRQLESGRVDLLLTDMVMTGMTGLDLLQKVRSSYPDLVVMMITGFGSIAMAVEAMYRGASDYLTKPCNNSELVLRVRRALKVRQQEHELSVLREEVRGTYSFGNIVTRSERMREIIGLIKQVADTDVTVLIQGESGTGKELVAHALHYNSNRQTGPFVAMNCSAIPDQLLESELFGHEKGAFTGALRQKKGKFEEAHTGTLFLDEIGDLDLPLQGKLLRVLQEKKFERLGGNVPVPVDTRVVAATNRNLELMTRQGDFREDLYYRLNVFPITLPPLRERPEDIPLLAEHFMRRHSGLGGSRVNVIAPSVISDMMNYPWRGNVRELENLIKRALIKSKTDTITVLELPAAAPRPPAAEGDSAAALPLEMPFKEYISAIVRDAEEKYLLKMLRVSKGNINQVAKLMDVDRKTVYRKMAEYSLDPSAYRD